MAHYHDDAVHELINRARTAIERARTLAAQTQKDVEAMRRSLAMTQDGLESWHVGASRAEIVSQ